MKHLIATLILVLATATTGFAQDKEQHIGAEAFFTQLVMQQLAEQPVLDPFFATKYLRGDAYSAWCLLHNKAEYERSAAERRPGRLTTVSDIRGEIRGGGSLTYGLGYGTVNYGNTRYNRTETNRIYEVGGRSGGPVMLYNPYMTPD